MAFNVTTIFFLVLGIFCFFYLLSQVTRVVSGSANFSTQLENLRQDFQTGDREMKEQARELEKMVRIMADQNREIFEMNQQIIYQNTQILETLEKVESDRRRRKGF